MTSRKDFIAVASLLAAALPQPAVAASPGPLSFAFDRARFEQILTKPVKHKQCFGSTKIADGNVLNAMSNSMDAYEEYFHEAPGSMQTVAVLYHGGAIALAMNDEVWNDLLTPFFGDKELQEHASADTRADIAQLRLGKGNPFLHASGDDVSIERLVSRGSSFFVCHNAMVGISHGIARATKAKAEEVHRRLLAGIVPGALVVPAGVMAINACQEARFTYIQSSL